MNAATHWPTASEYFRNAWDRISTGNDSFFPKHPLLSQYGRELSSEAYFWISTHRNMAEDPPTVVDVMYAMAQVMAFEKPYHRQLEGLARKMIAEVWGVDEEILLPQLTDKLDSPRGYTGGSLGAPEGLEVIPNLDMSDIISLYDMSSLGSVHSYFGDMMAASIHMMKSGDHDMQMGSSRVAWADQLDRPYDPGSHRKPVAFGKLPVGLQRMAHVRTTTNLLAQGASVHQMMTLHHSAYGDLEKVFTGAYPAMKALPIPHDRPLVIAKATTFPVLLQELSKGVAQIISMHAMDGLTDDELHQIADHTDYYENEFYLIQAGPQLWRYLLMSLPRRADIKRVLMKLYLSDDIHDILGRVIEAKGQQSPELDAVREEIAQLLE